MSEESYKRVLVKLREFFGEVIIERIERAIGADFETLLDTKLEDTLIRLLEEIHRNYILPLDNDGPN